MQGFSASCPSAGVCTGLPGAWYTPENRRQAGIPKRFSLNKRNEAGAGFRGCCNIIYVRTLVHTVPHIFYGIWEELVHAHGPVVLSLFAFALRYFFFPVGSYG